MYIYFFHNQKIHAKMTMMISILPVLVQKNQLYYAKTEMIMVFNKLARQLVSFFQVKASFTNYVGVGNYSGSF